MLNKVQGGGVLHPRSSLDSITRGFSGILLLMFLTQWSRTPWIIAPFGATCVLLFALPGSPLAQPRSIIGGHLVSTLVGLLFINIMGDSALSSALAVGSSIAAMQTLRVVHAPAGADPLVVILSGIYGFDFLLTPVLLGSIALVLVGIIVNNAGKGLKWPQYWIGTNVNPTITRKDGT